MLRFQNDYSEGAHPNVLRALCDTNLCSTPGYGLDDDCRRAADAIRARFACPDAAHQAVRFVTSWATTDAQVDALLAVLAQVLD